MPALHFRKITLHIFFCNITTAILLKSEQKSLNRLCNFLLDKIGHVQVCVLWIKINQIKICMSVYILRSSSSCQNIFCKFFFHFYYSIEMPSISNFWSHSDVFIVANFKISYFFNFFFPTTRKVFINASVEYWLIHSWVVHFIIYNTQLHFSWAKYLSDNKQCDHWQNYNNSHEP